MIRHDLEEGPLGEGPLVGKVELFARSGEKTGAKEIE